MPLLGSRNLCVLPVFLQNLQTHPYAMALPSALKQPPPGYTHKCIERFLHSIWRYRSKSSMVHGESALLSVPGAFSLFQDADSVRHKDWVLLGQLLRLHSGQLLAPIDKICLRTPGQDSFGLRGLEKRERKADKGLQGRNFFSKKKKRIFHQRNLTWLYISSSTSHLFTFQSDI